MVRNLEITKVKGFDVWLLVARVNLKVQRALNKKLSEIGLSLPQHEILMATFFQPGATQKQIADSLLAVKSNLSMHINNLEEKGLIKRKTDEADSRIKRLWLTANAEQLVSQSFEIQNSIVSSMVGSVSSAELELIEELMNRVDSVLDQIIEA